MRQSLERVPTKALCLLLLSALPLAAAPIDESRLPPAATQPVDFLRDVKPILDAHCMKCHGATKPKSGFRVDDRSAILEGGDNGLAVSLGDSGKSPLIHYVARLEPELEMPPEGKGTPLTDQQIGLLRAWIDQGLVWPDEAIAAKTVFEFAPFTGWITVDGNEQRFQQNEWLREGWDGGVRHFELRQQLDLDRKLTLSGHASRDDYEVLVSWERADTLFFRAGFEQYRKYFDDSGGYYESFTPSLTSLGRDLHLDIGKAWFEAGGITPFGLELTAGYEYQFKEGEKSLSGWMPTGPAADPKNILPNAKEIDEHLHVLRLDAAYDWSKFRFTDTFRYEWHDLETSRGFVRAGFPPGPSTQRMWEGDSIQNLANAFTTEVAPLDWVLLSAGYLYTHTDGESSFRQTSTGPGGVPATGLLWNGRGIALDQSAHVFNANAQLRVWEGFTLSSGVQTEWERQHSFGTVHLDQTDFFDPAIVIGNTNRVSGDYDRFVVEEKFVLRNTQIPFTVVYGDVRFRQQQIDRLDRLGPSGAGAITGSDFVRDTDARYDWRRYRAGFTVSPWSRVSLNAYAQRRDRDDTFKHDRDEGPAGSPGIGYSAFITGRETMADEVGGKLVLRPLSWLKTTLSYKLRETDYETKTDPTAIGPSSTPGGRIQSGEYDAHIYGFNATLTPWRRIYLYSTFVFQDSETVTADNGSLAIAPFEGETYSVLSTVTYLLSEQTDLNLSYDFSYANYRQDNEALGLPLGIDYRRHGIRAGLSRRFWNRFLASVEYLWAYYEEPSSGNFNDYTAHGVFATVHVAWD